MINKIIMVLLILLVLTGCTKKVVEDSEVALEEEEFTTSAGYSENQQRFTVSNPDIHTEDMGNGLVRIYGGN